MAKKLKPQSAPDPQSANDFLTGYQELRAAQREIDAATEHKRAILKRMKGQGTHLNALVLLQRLIKLEAGAAWALLATTVRYAQWASFPIGTQAELFAAPDDTQPTEKAKTEYTEFSVEDAGYCAGKSGEPIDNNPHAPGTLFYGIWVTGWHNGQAANAPGQADPEEPPATETRRPRRGRKGNGEERPVA